LPRIAAPKLFADTFDFQGAVFSARIFRPVYGQPHFDKLGTQISSVGQVAGRNQTVMRQAFVNFSADNLPTAQAYHRRFCALTVGVVKLRGINAGKANGFTIDADRIPIYHPAGSLDLLRYELD
jgi:hypothetical protein